MKRNRVFILIPVLIILIVIIAFYGSRLFQSKDSSVSSSNPKISKKNQISEKAQIYDKDLNMSVYLPYKGISSYDSYGDHIFMSADDNSPSEMANKIFQYNRKTKKVEELFTTKFDSSSVQGVKANNKWVTWVDSDDFGEQKNIYIMNKKTKKIEPVTKENEKSIKSGFPVLAENHLAWIYHDQNNNKSYVIIRDLKARRNKIIFNLNTHSLDNADLSIHDEKILFTDKRKGKSYLYVYDISKQKLEKFQSPHKNIGWGELLNDHQIVYLAFFSKSFADNKLVLYDTHTKKAKEFSSKYMEVNRLQVDANNHVFVGTGGDNFFQTYLIDKEEIKKLGKINEKDVYSISANNGVYIMNIIKRNDEEKLIITTNLPK
ncbi:hypothetical protein J6TS2_39640 [Heyndrickxia sporothermodurans]|nr:hypothetical protein J6TS2_39640 [Heyndrickxia sporothermodurans]